MQVYGARKVKGNLIHHSDRGSQYLNTRYPEQPAEIGIEAEVIWRRGPWRNREAIEHAALEWVPWFDIKRLLEPIGNIPPIEFEKSYYDVREGLAAGAGLN